jgi:enoyl-CoA hydratase
MGLANRMVPAGTAREEAERLAQVIAGFPPEAVRSDRLSCYAAHGVPITTALETEFTLGQQARQSSATQDGLRRFREGAGRGGRF